MSSKYILKNKAKYKEYNGLRKQIFSEAAPGESELILYLLPWLLSINHPKCPGFVPDIKTLFHVFNVEVERDIRKRDLEFEEMFGVGEEGRLLKPKARFRMIQGLYSIGSMGTISQTSDSDCDIWVCYDKRDFEGDELGQLKEKLELIQGWFEKHCKIPLFFFLSEIRDIRECRFGAADEESSGSSQASVLKEEFYRTCMVICGKIPLWWLCYVSNKVVDYDEARHYADAVGYMDDDIIDMGNLENVRSDEYFGASLWQLNKSIGSPLKSIIKMLLLKMQLEASDEELVCHRFRQHVMVKGPLDMIPDPSMFSMYFIMSYYQNKSDVETLQFIKECFYLRCGAGKFRASPSLRQRLIRIFFRKFRIDPMTRETLERFSEWDFDEQLVFGRKIFKFLVRLYKDISESHSGIVSGIESADITVIGRKIQCYYGKKEAKVHLLPLLFDTVNVSRLIFCKKRAAWQVYSGRRGSDLIFVQDSLLEVIAFTVKNRLFEPEKSSMEPNPSALTTQDILSMGLKMRSFFEPVMAQITTEDYLKASCIKKCLIVAGFEGTVTPSRIDEISAVYVNSWGEMFIRSFTSVEGLRRCLKGLSFECTGSNAEICMPPRYMEQAAVLAAVARGLKYKMT